MGLTLHVHSRVPASLNLEDVGTIVARWHALAENFAAEGRVDAVFETSNEADDLNTFATSWLTLPHPTEPDTVTGVAVPPLEGWMFLVRLGAGCEPFALGLCRYPETVRQPGTGATLATGKGRGWHFLSSCKTQYASNQGWEHFLRCHTAAVDLAAAGQALGVDVQIEDEGGYWPDRNEAALRTALDRLNGLVAAVAGALKDASNEEEEAAESDHAGDASVSGHLTEARSEGREAVRSPIFEHPGFERLEAEGQAGADAEKIAAAVRAIRNASRGTHEGKD